VGLSPTYIGCPATEVIRARHKCLKAADIGGFEVDPGVVAAWNQRLDHGGRPPQAPRLRIVLRSARSSNMRDVLRADRPVACPRCHSVDTETLSQFGSNPVQGVCIAAGACLEPFEYFKCHLTWPL